MRSNNKSIELTRHFIKKISSVTHKFMECVTLGLAGKHLLASLMICLMLLPLFALPTGASAASGNTNVGEFEPVNEQLSVWTESWRKVNSQVESWTTRLRPENSLFYENDDKKKNKEKDKTAQDSVKDTVEVTSSNTEKTSVENENLSNIGNLRKVVKKLETKLPRSMEMQIGQSITLSAIALDKKGRVVNEAVIDWESSDDAILNVRDNQASAVKEGTAKLTAKAGNISVTFKVEVKKTLETIPTTSALVPVEDDDEFRSGFSPQNNLGAPIGQVEAQSFSQPAALRNALERPGSSNFGFGFPVAALPGRGIDAGISLTYNSRVWNYWESPIGGSAARYRYNLDQNWLAPGFNLSLGKLTRISGPNTTVSYNLTSPDGTRQELSYISGTGNTFESTDGTFSKLEISNDASGTRFGVLKNSDGTTINFSGTTVNLLPTKITDKNGNIIEISYLPNDVSGRIASIKDTLNRLIKFYYDSGNKLVAVTVPALNGSSETQTIRFYYETINFDTTLRRFGIGATPIMPASIQALKYVYFPGTQTGYKYDYSSGYGMVYKVSNLRGMQVNSSGTSETGLVTNEGQVAASTTYNYPLTVGTPLAGVPNYTTRTDDWAGRTTAQPAITTYQVEKDTNNNLTKSKITSPDGTIAETWAKINEGEWDDGLVTDTFVKTPIGSQFQTYKIWSHSQLFWGNQPAANGRQNPRVVKAETTNEAEQTRATTFEYDDYNNPLKIRQHDFAPSGQAGTELERTEITYETDSNWISRGFTNLPIVVKKIVNDEIVSRIDYEFDNYGANETDMMRRNDIIMYDQSYNPSSPSYNASTKYRANVTKVTAFSKAWLPSDPDASITSIKYDIAGNEVETIANCCVKLTSEYDKSTEYAYQKSEARGSNGELTTNATYDFNTGLTKTFTDENNQTSTFTYDQNNLRRIRVDAPNGGYSTFEYHDGLVNGPNGLKWSYVKSTVKIDSNKELSTWNYVDGRGAAVRSLGPQLNGVHQDVTDVQYDAMGRVARASYQYAATSFSSPINPSSDWTVPSYDPLGRTKLVTLPDGNKTRIELNGTIATITDQAGKTRRQIADALGNVIRTDEPDANNNLGDVNSPLFPTSFEHDGNDNLIKITHPGNGITQVREFKYDSLSRMTHEKQIEALQTLDDNGVKVSTGGRWTGVYKYNSSGSLVEGINSRGAKGVFTYDTLNRIKTVNYTDETGYQTPNLTYTYDEERASYLNKGQLTKIETAPVGTETPATSQVFDYDLMGNVKKQTQTVGANSYILEYSYNLGGQLISQKYPSGRVINLETDAIGNPSAISDTQRSYVSNIQYNSHGAIGSINYGNGTVESYGFSSKRLQLTSQILSKGNEVLQKYEYGYGKVDLATGDVDATKNNGKLAKVDSYIGGTTSNPTKQWQQRFDYDELGRLREVREHRGDTNNLSYKYIFDFDRFGNLFRKQTSNPIAGQEHPLTYQPIENSDIDKTSNRFAPSTGTQYDETGNVTRDTKFRSRDYKYDINGRMIWSKLANGTGSESTSIYDALGNRVAAKVDESWRVSVFDIGGKIVAEYGGLTPTDEGGVKYILQDRQGSTRAILNQSGFVQTRLDYQAFGAEIGSNVGLRTTAQGFSANSTIRNKFALTERDEATGLDHTDWRKFDNQAGRWTSPDPYKGSMSTLNPQSFNRYSYVNNEPINSVDPSGLDFYWVPTVKNKTERWWSPGSSKTRSWGNGGGGLSSSGRGGGGGKKGGKKCPLSEKPITDAEASRIESYNGNYFDYENLTTATKDALNCLINYVNPWLSVSVEVAVAEAKNPESPYFGRSLKRESGFRPEAYQAHLYDIYDLSRKLKKYGKECSALKKEVQRELQMHGLKGVVAENNSRHSSGTGFDLSITGVSQKQITLYANQCGLDRITNIPGEESHFMLKGQ